MLIYGGFLVNKNLSLAGFMSADHKKKLLWGSKKAQVEQVKLFEC